MSELPKNWATTKLIELSEDISYGFTASSTQENIGPRLLRITDIQNNHVSWDSVPFCEIDQTQAQKYLLKENDLVFARTGATVGKSFLIKGEIPESVFASYLIRVRCLRPELASFLAYYFRSPDYWLQITEFSAGIGQPNVNGSKLKELNIPVPPLVEQIRIAQKLDELLAQVDTLKARIDAIPSLLKRFRHSVLSAAVSGQLTEDWRGDNKVPYDNSLPTNWNLKKAEEISSFITKGTTPSKEKMSADHGEVPYVKVYNLTFTGVLDFTIDPTFVDTSTHSIELKRSIVKPGDVLMNIVGPPLGKVSIVPTTYPEWNINQAIARFRAGDEISSKYLALCLQTTSVLNHAISRAKATAGQFNLTLEICRELPIPVPPKDEQTEIVRRVEQLFAFADQLEAKVASAKTRIDQLTQSILAKAFRGELVPQDPNDEPASVLLERIKAQRDAAPKSKRGRKVSA